MNHHIDIIDAQQDVANAKGLKSPGLVEQAQKDLSDIKNAKDN